MPRGDVPGLGDGRGHGMRDGLSGGAVGGARQPSVTLESSTTFRDLGGHPTARGGRTRHGLVYRSAALTDVRPRDRAVLEALDLAVVIDLRAAFEVSATGTTVYADLDVPRVHVPVLDAADASGYARQLRRHVPSVDGGYPDLGEIYTSMLDRGGNAFARAFSLVASHRPSLHLCTAGKDRTGLLSALLLRVAEVPDSFIAVDYACSVPSGDSAPIERALAHLDRRWGGAEAYLAAHGVKRCTIDAFRADFVASAPTVIVLPDDAELAAG